MGLVADWPRLSSSDRLLRRYLDQAVEMLTRLQMLVGSAARTPLSAVAIKHRVLSAGNALLLDAENIARDYPRANIVCTLTSCHQVETRPD